MSDQARSRKLHAEAQQRYLQKLRKRRAPTTSAIWLAVGRAFASVSNAQSVNTGMSRDIIERVLQDAIERLQAAGYDRQQSLQRMRQALVSQPDQRPDKDVFDFSGPMPGM